MDYNHCCKYVKIMELETLLAIIVAKQLIFGSEFSFIKWIKYKKDYWKKYNKWLSEKP